MPEEIERRFLVRNLPDNLRRYNHCDIDQGYFLCPNWPEIEQRLRRKEDKYYFTTKTFLDGKRNETEIEIPESTFLLMWKDTEGRRIEKVRYDVPLNRNKVEVNIYCGQELEGLVVAEIEFRTQGERDAFVPPEWLGKEVSEDQRYNNYMLATQGFPILM